MKLSDKALLVQLNISQWTARKYDKRATEQVAQQNASALTAGRYNKSLLPMNDALTNIHQKSTLIRKKFYTNTLPWGIEGTMMLPSANYLNFMTEFRKKSEWQTLVDAFFQEYPRLHADAQSSLVTCTIVMTILLCMISNVSSRWIWLCSQFHRMTSV